MKKLLSLLLVTFMLSFFMVGCAGKIFVQSMNINPSNPSPGDEVVARVTLNKFSEKVETVKGKVREYPQYSFTFNNNGEDGDEKAGDNIWSRKMDIPYNAPSQTFHLDITVLDKEGNIIATENAEDENREESGTIDLKIE
ncbi:MAG: hypothetical protein V5A59_01890 [Bacteroidales bacterium]|nr:hypothetical protein [Bacteroidales bacterium]MBS3776124.1 hypothetical protein [Bacteroidales bacterium]